jgi:tRNA uridine 5-carbamoylmethylation protein Kti12
MNELITFVGMVNKPKPTKHKKGKGRGKSMKELTKDHDEFMKDRNSDRQVENDDAKEKFEELLKKIVKKK